MERAMLPIDGNVAPRRRLCGPWLIGGAGLSLPFATRAWFAPSAHHSFYMDCSFYLYGLLFATPLVARVTGFAPVRRTLFARAPASRAVDGHAASGGNRGHRARGGHCLERCADLLRPARWGTIAPAYSTNRWANTNRPSWTDRRPSCAQRLTN